MLCGYINLCILYHRHAPIKSILLRNTVHMLQQYSFTLLATNTPSVRKDILEYAIICKCEWVESNLSNSNRSTKLQRRM